MIKPQMTMDEARQILRGIIPAKSAGLDGELGGDGSNGSVYWKPIHATAELEGNFTADDLIAIGIWMQNNYDGGEP